MELSFTTTLMGVRLRALPSTAPLQRRRVNAWPWTGGFGLVAMQHGSDRRSGHSGHGQLHSHGQEQHHRADLGEHIAERPLGISPYILYLSASIDPVPCVQ